MTNIRLEYSREYITGYPNYHQISDLGVTQFEHCYDQGLLNYILQEANRIKASHSEMRQLNLNYIRDAASFIPEINELFNSAERIERAQDIAGTKLEPYPISVISSIITFTSPSPNDGAITWHADGVPVTELIPLEIFNPVGGELELYRGSADEGLSKVHKGQSIAPEKIIQVKHQEGYSVLGQLMRLMHRVNPMTQGHRTTLNLNFRSAIKPFIDDNSMCYLAADNPDFSWQEKYIEDVREKQLPAYMNSLKRG